MHKVSITKEPESYMSIASKHELYCITTTPIHSEYIATL